MLKTVLSDYMKELLELYKTQPSLESQEALLALKKMIASALSYIPDLPGKENIDIEISGIHDSSKPGFFNVPTMRVWDRKSKIYGYIHVLDPHQELDLKLNSVPRVLKQMYPHVIYTNLFEFFPCKGEQVRNKIRPFRVTSAKGISDDFKVQSIWVFLRSLEDFLRWRPPLFQSTSFLEMQRQLAFKTFFLRQNVLKPLLNKQTLLRGVQGGGFLEKNPPGRRRQTAFPGLLAHSIIDCFIKACIFHNTVQKEEKGNFSRSALVDYARYTGMSARRLSLFQLLSSEDNLLPGSLKWVMDDIACLLSEFDFKGMGFNTANPGSIPGEELQWYEYFFLPYYDKSLEIAIVIGLLQREGIISAPLAPVKNMERRDNG